MKKPSEFTDRQWAMCRKYNVARLFSAICASFAPQFLMLYIMQHITVQDKAMHSVAVTMTGMVASIVIAAPWIVQRIDKLVIPLMWVLLACGICFDLMVLQYPFLAMITSAILFKFVDLIIDGGFKKISNRVLQGDAKTMFSFLNNRAAMVGLCLASAMCYVCAGLDLRTVVIIDIILSVIDTVLICLRVKWLKAELPS